MTADNITQRVDLAEIIDYLAYVSPLTRSVYGRDGGSPFVSNITVAPTKYGEINNDGHLVIRLVRRCLVSLAVPFQPFAKLVA
jgi:hypothetical protein